MITPQLTSTNVQDIIARMNERMKIKSSLVHKAVNLMSHLCSYSYMTKQESLYRQLSMAQKSIWTLLRKGPFEIACEVVYEQAALRMEDVRALNMPHISYSPEDVQELKTLIEQYRNILPEETALRRKTTPKQTEKINKALEDLNALRARG